MNNTGFPNYDDPPLTLKQLSLRLKGFQSGIGAIYCWQLELTRED